MGSLRNGSRSFLNLLAHACKLSHLPGFQTGVTAILGLEEATAFFALWEPLCSFVDTLVALDNWYNQKDHQNDDGAGEDNGGI